jgi:hypothetical protein
MKMNYFVFGTNNLPAAVNFYDTLFTGMGISQIYSEGRMTIWAGDGFMFGVAQPYNGEPATNGNGTMLGLSLGSADEVKRLYKKVLELGGSDEGEPGLRMGRVAAYVRDLDKNKICLFE